MTKVTNILLAGVGGQGTLLASEVLSEVLMLAGYDVKKKRDSRYVPTWRQCVFACPVWRRGVFTDYSGRGDGYPVRL